jgi:hypothetical protein
MGDDTAALMDRLDVGKADVFGWRDGGIEALGLAITDRHRCVLFNRRGQPDASDHAPVCIELADAQ